MTTSNALISVAPIENSGDMGEVLPLTFAGKKKSMMVFNREAPIKTPKAALWTQNASMSEFKTG